MLLVRLKGIISSSACKAFISFLLHVLLFGDMLCCSSCFGALMGCLLVGLYCTIEVIRRGFICSCVLFQNWSDKDKVNGVSFWAVEVMFNIGRCCSTCPYWRYYLPCSCFSCVVVWWYSFIGLSAIVVFLISFIGFI